MKPIDFWFSIGSTYTYLTVMRLREVEREAKVTFNWRPFDVRTIMTAQKNIPFANKPIKMAYMWRDIERRAAKYGLPISVPAPYPIEHLAFANQVALVGVQLGWCPAYVTETYRLWFQEGLPAGSEPNLSKKPDHNWAGSAARDRLGEHSSNRFRTQRANGSGREGRGLWIT